MFHKIYFHCLYNLTYSTTPYVYQEPIIFMASGQLLHSMDLESGRRITSLMGDGKPNRPFSLEFSLNHCLEIEDYSSVDADKLKFVEIELSLKKYIHKIVSDEVYEERARNPVEIPLPDMNTDILGFKLHISPFSYRTDSQKLKKGCQLISLYYDTVEGEEVNTEIMENIVQKFKQFIKVLPPEFSEIYWGFKFIIKMKNQNDSNTEIVFTTKMFRFIIYNQLNLVTIKAVDEKDYHI